MPGRRGNEVNFSKTRYIYIQAAQQQQQPDRFFVAAARPSCHFRREQRSDHLMGHINRPIERKED